MLSKYQSMMADFYDIPTDNVKRLVSNFFDKEKYVPHYQNLQHYLRLGLKLVLSCMRTQSITMAKTICRISYAKQHRSRKETVAKMEKLCIN